MSEEREFEDQVRKALAKYEHAVRLDVQARWDSWELDLSKNEFHEVIAALLARQASMAVYFARSPESWTPIVGPILMRTMTDTYITLAWILKDPMDRSRKFIHYGLGQEKLQVEHMRAAEKAAGRDPDEHEGIRFSEMWVDSQQYRFLTEVNVGSWSEKTTRQMASEADCLDLHRHAYVPESSVAHSMWNSVGRVNLRMCANPLHRYHKVPLVPRFSPWPPMFGLAVERFDETLDLLDEALSWSPAGVSALEQWRESAEQLWRDYGPAEGETDDGSEETE